MGFPEKVVAINGQWSLQETNAGREPEAFIAYSRRAVPGTELGHEIWRVFVCKAGE